MRTSWILYRAQLLGVSPAGICALFFAAVFTIGAQEHLPSSYVPATAVFGSRDSSVLSPIFSMQGFRASASYTYFDMLHATRKSVPEENTIYANTAEYSRGQFDAGLTKEDWGISIAGSTGNGFVQFDDSRKDYALQGHTKDKTAQLAGWTCANHVLGILGAGFNSAVGPWQEFEAGKEFPANTITQLGNDPRIGYLAAAGVRFPKVALVGFTKKQVLPVSRLSIINQSNDNSDAISLAADRRDHGLAGRIAASFGGISFHGSLTELFSDTSADTGDFFPALATGAGIGGAISISADSLLFKPFFHVTGLVLKLGARTYEAPGAGPFAFLDSNTMQFFNGRAGVVLPWSIETGILGEYSYFANDKPGRFDPYVFSEMTFFDPTKVRIDAVRMEYWSAGGFLSGRVRFLKHHELNLITALSRMSIEGNADTRDYDFSLLIPRLTNPRHYALFGGEFLLIGLSLDYSLSIGNLQVRAGAAQLIPIDVADYARSSEPASVSAGFKDSMRGGTRYQVSLTFDK